MPNLPTNTSAQPQRTFPILIGLFFILLVTIPLIILLLNSHRNTPVATRITPIPTPSPFFLPFKELGSPAAHIGRSFILHGIVKSINKDSLVIERSNHTYTVYFSDATKTIAVDSMYPKKHPNFTPFIPGNIYLNENIIATGIISKDASLSALVIYKTPKDAPQQ